MKKTFAYFLFTFAAVIIFLSFGKISFASSCPSSSNIANSNCPVCPTGDHYSFNNGGSCVDASGNYITSTCSIISCQSSYSCSGTYPGSSWATKNGCCDSSGNCYTSSSGPNPTPSPTPVITAAPTSSPQASTPQNNSQTCLSCPDIAGTSGHGLLKTNLSQYNTLNCPSVDVAVNVCLYSGVNGHSICNAAVPQTCNSSQKCDAIVGCIDKNSIPPSSCTKSGNICYSDANCTTSTGSCTGYHCMQGGYIIVPGAAINGTCKYAPGALLPPGVSSGIECDPSKQNSCGNGEVCLPDADYQKFSCQIGTLQNQFNQINCLNNSCRTALGDFSTDPYGFITRIFGLILSISGGIALLLIIISGYRVLASQGNPETLKGAREQLTAAIVGLLFIIFALVILEIIGFNILHIPAFKPGFGGGSSGGGFW